MNDSHRRPVTVFAFAVVVAVVACGLWLGFRSPAQIIQGMADSDTINVSAKISARVRELHVAEGDRVGAGQVLFELDSPEVVAKQNQALALLTSARAQQSKAQEGARREEILVAAANWRRTAAATELARSTGERVENLFREGVATRQRRDEIQAQFDQAQAAQAAARAQYDQALAGARTQDRASADAQVNQALGAVAEIQAASDETQGRAPTGAEVGKRLVDIGELVPAGYPVFTLVDIDHMWIALNVREDQFKGLEIGGKLHGDIPALQRKDVEFAIYFISPAGDFATWRATRQSAGYDVKTFEVRARASHLVRGLRPGMSVLFDWPQH
jgi:HlyD family secretion protein